MPIVPADVSAALQYSFTGPRARHLEAAVKSVQVAPPSLLRYTPFRFANDPLFPNTETKRVLPVGSKRAKMTSVDSRRKIPVSTIRATSGRKATRD